MATSSQIVTAEELFRMPSGAHRYELVRGELHIMSPAGGKHGSVSMRLGSRLATYVEQRRLGETCGSETGFLLERDPDTVLAPDFAFIDQSRIPASGVPDAFWRIPPDFAVDVMSPSDSLAKAETKVAAWLSYGAREIWLVDPKKRTVSIYRPAESPRVLTEHDSLTIDLIPGFSCRVSEIFPPVSGAT